MIRVAETAGTLFQNATSLGRGRSGGRGAGLKEDMEGAPAEEDWDEEELDELSSSCDTWGRREVSVLLRESGKEMDGVVVPQNSLLAAGFKTGV